MFTPNHFIFKAHERTRNLSFMILESTNGKSCYKERFELETETLRKQKMKRSVKRMEQMRPKKCKTPLNFLLESIPPSIAFWLANCHGTNNQILFLVI